ncbi:MAG: hypothetical protein WDM92_00820 [Caulobacteraceae bacterium]
MLFAGVVMTMAAGPYVFGAVFDATGSYNSVLFAAAPVCVFAAALTFGLNPYRTRSGVPMA